MPELTSNIEINAQIKTDIDRIVETIGRGEHAVIPILMQLNQENSSYEKELLTIFSQIKDQAIKPLKEILSDFEQNPTLRRLAARTIGKLRFTTLVSALDNCVRNDPDWVTRYEAAVALGLTGTYRAVDALKKGLVDDNWSVRRASVSSLGLIGDKSSADLIITCLNLTGSPINIVSESSG